MEKRDYTPSAEVFESIADRLDVSVDYLLGRSASLDSPESVPSPDTAELIDIYNELSPVDRAKLLVFADELRSKGKQV